MVVAYALAGTVDLDLTREPLGLDRQGAPVYLHEIWPSSQEILQTIAQCIDPDMFRLKYADVFSGDESWRAIKINEGELYAWDEASTYIQEPPFFLNLTRTAPHIQNILGARALAVAGLDLDGSGTARGDSCLQKG